MNRSSRQPSVAGFTPPPPPRLPSIVWSPGLHAGTGRRFDRDHRRTGTASVRGLASRRALIRRSANPAQPTTAASFRAPQRHTLPLGRATPTPTQRTPATHRPRATRRCRERCRPTGGLRALPKLDPARLLITRPIPTRGHVGHRKVTTRRRQINQGGALSLRNRTTMGTAVGLRGVPRGRHQCCALNCARGLVRLGAVVPAVRRRCRLSTAGGIRTLCSSQIVA